ncbi:hypothetical protein P7C65_11s1g19900 [Encephalitozoon intestinalis]|nr:hypothetical protein GPK93_11g21640 [Encephalitozoon intestinalis]
MKEEHLQDIRKKVTAELTEIKRATLEKMRQRLREAFDLIPTEVKGLPFLSLIEGLERNYTGKAVILKKNEGIVSRRTPKDVKKRPSVMLQVEDQSFIFDGDGLKVVGPWNGKEYKGMVEEINGILKKHITKL